MRTVRVEVTAEDIAAGVRNDCDECPIARALSRAAGYPLGAGAMGVYEQGRLRLITKWPDGGACSPQSHFISDFDDGQRVEPFAFDIDLPEAQP